MRRLWWRVEFKPQDCWIGVYWRRSHLALADKLDVWVCLLPMLPLHVWRFYNVEKGEEVEELPLDSRQWNLSQIARHSARYVTLMEIERAREEGTHAGGGPARQE